MRIALLHLPDEYFVPAARYVLATFRGFVYEPTAMRSFQWLTIEEPNLATQIAAVSDAVATRLPTAEVGDCPMCDRKGTATLRLRYIVIQDPTRLAVVPFVMVCGDGDARCADRAKPTLDLLSMLGRVALPPPPSEHQGPITYSCRQCSREQSKMSVCGRCERVHYCSPLCFKMDWPRHKPFCLPAPPAPLKDIRMESKE